MANLESLNKSDLVELAEEKGLDTSGTKADIIARLEEAELEEEEEEEEEDVEEEEEEEETGKKQRFAVTGFSTAGSKTLPMLSVVDIEELQVFLEDIIEESEANARPYDVVTATRGKVSLSVQRGA